MLFPCPPLPSLRVVIPRGNAGFAAILEDVFDHADRFNLLSVTASAGGYLLCCQLFILCKDLKPSKKAAVPAPTVFAGVCKSAMSAAIFTFFCNEMVSEQLKVRIVFIFLRQKYLSVRLVCTGRNEAVAMESHSTV